MAEISPGLIVVLGALLIPLLRGQLRSGWLVALPLLALAHLMWLPAGEAGQVTLMGLELTSLRVDALSRWFGIALLVALVLGMVFALELRDPVEPVAAMISAGSALGAVLAGDLVVLYVFWVPASVASTFVIWAARSEGSYRAGMRYILFHVLAGLLLLEGLLHFHHDYGTIVFDTLSLGSSAGWMVLGAFGIAAAFPVLHMWIPDSYGAATPTGTVLLQPVLPLLGVYALARGFPGFAPLIAVGSVAILGGLLMAVVESDLRRSLAYVLVSQLGVLVVGVGVGSAGALAGLGMLAVGHAIFMSLLFMAVAAVIHARGTAAAGALGGLAGWMPWIAGLAAVGALSISTPLLAGFPGRALLMAAAADGGQVWAWTAIAVGTAGGFAVGGLRLLWLAFYGPAEGRDERQDAPANMRAAMALGAGLSLVFGIVAAWLPVVDGVEPYAMENVLGQLQIVAFAALGFVVMQAFGQIGRPKPATVLDFDWLYRRAGRAGALRGLALARRARAAALGAAGQGLDGARGRIRAYFGLHGVIARNWTTGAMAFWTTVLLAFWLLAYLF